MNYIFEEDQRFTQWWIWMLLAIFPILSIVLFFLGEANVYYVLGCLILPLFFYAFQLRIKVNEEGLHYQFAPFHFKSHTIKLDEIEKFEALQYKPLAEYGGWGIKYGFKGKAYNVSGNLGVKIYLANGRNILFGSQKHKELEKVLKQIKKP